MQAASIPWGTQWDLARAADDSVDWSAIAITLGFQDGRAGGRSAVNRYFGTCTDQGDGRLALGPFGMTMMAGPPHAMAAEAAYHRLLEQVRGIGRDSVELVLTDGSGAELLAYVPSADPS
jgi:heat shock protein HslJ